jgi:hypothetical protein
LQDAWIRLYVARKKPDVNLLGVLAGHVVKQVQEPHVKVDEFLLRMAAVLFSPGPGLDFDLFFPAGAGASDPPLACGQRFLCSEPESRHTDTYTHIQTFVMVSNARTVHTYARTLASIMACTCMQ